MDSKLKKRIERGHEPWIVPKTNSPKTRRKKAIQGRSWMAGH